MSTGMSGDGRKFSVKDVENYHQKERLRALHEARVQFFDVRRRITELELEGQINEYSADKAMRDAVEELVFQCEQLMQREDIAESLERNYWQSCFLGELNVPHGARLPERIRPKFNGLQSIVEAPDPIPIIFERETVELGEPGGTEMEVEAMQIPRKPILENAYRKVEEFLSHVDLGLQLETGRPYDDWREEFEDGVYHGPEDFRDGENVPK